MVARKTGGKWSGQIGRQLQHLAQQLRVLRIEIPTKPSGHNPGVATSFNTEAWLFMLKIFDDALPRTDFKLEADMFHDPEKKVRMRPITSFSRTIVICMVSLTRPCNTRPAQYKLARRMQSRMRKEDDGRISKEQAYDVRDLHVCPHYTLTAEEVK